MKIYRTITDRFHTEKAEQKESKKLSKTMPESNETMQTSVINENSDTPSETRKGRPKKKAEEV